MDISKIVIIAALTMLASCGKKGALLPPEALVPGTVESLRVDQKGDNFQISWSPPAREQGGSPLRDLAGFRLLRHEVPAGGNDCTACSDAWQLLDTIELDYPSGTIRSGNYYFYRDGGVKSGTVVQYRLLAYSRSGGVSRPLTSDARKRAVPPAAPVLLATALPTAIRLTFTPSPPASGVTGFNIYRRQPGEPPPPFPLNPAPLPTAEWEDLQLRYGQTYLYSATAISILNGQQVESAPSGEVEILFTLPELK